MLIHSVRRSISSDSSPLDSLAELDIFNNKAVKASRLCFYFKETVKFVPQADIVHSKLSNSQVSKYLLIILT